MAVIIPDLFGAFQKGREYAIDRNWKDLENYETIEKMRTANDMAQLALLQERYYTPLKMSMFADNADNSAMQNQIQFTAYPGALSNARQFTNQALSNEGVQKLTLPDTAQTQVATTLANNRVARGEATEKNAYAGNVDWEGKGKANAGVTNTKTGNAVKNAITEQEVWELAQQVRKYEYGDAIFKAGVDIALRKYYRELQELKAKGDIEGQKRLLERSMEEARVNAGNGTGQSFEVDLTQMTDAGLANLKRNAVAVLNKPDATPEEKFAAQRQIVNIDTVFAGRGFTQPVERGSISFITNTSDYRLPMFRNAVPLATQQVANQPQDLAGGGQPQQNQPQQTTYQSPADADLAAYENKIKTKSKFGAEQKNRILGAINLQRNSSLFNTWGGIVGENDQYRGSVLVNGRPIPYSTNTAVNLTALGNDLTPLQRDLKQSLLLSGEFPVKSVNGKLEFDLNKLFPRIENNQVLTNPLINRGGNYGTSSTNPQYK